MPSRAKFLREWFDIVAGAMKSKSPEEITLREIQDYFATTNEQLNGEAFDPSRPEHRHGVTRTLEIVLPLYERWGFIEARVDEDRYTRNVRFHVPARVGKLSSRGTYLSGRSKWQRHCFFAVASFTIAVASFFKRFKVVISVIGGALVISKLVLEWGNIPAAIAVIGAGVVAFIFTSFGQSGD